MVKRLYILILAMVFAIMFGVTSMVAPITVSADDTYYSSPLDDLSKDSNFNASEYPVVNDKYSIEVIQIAESANNELFVYTYQPCQDTYPLVATEINMSLSADVGCIVDDDGNYVAGSATSKLYKLEFLNSDGVFAKYKVSDFTVSNDIARYYTISTIYRVYIEDIDGSSGNDNTILSKAFPVGKQYVAITTENGVSYACKNIDFVVIKNPFVDFLAYGTYDGFDLIFGNVDYTDIHYIAFTPDRQIDTLKEADVTYTTTPYTLNGDGPNTGYSYGEKSEPQFKTLTGKEQVGVDGHPEFTWNSIYTSEAFMATTTLTGEAKTQVENSQFVLVFLATHAEEKYLTDWMQGHYKKVTGTKVSDVTILRLMFETDGVTYNLGVVMDKQEGDDIAGNKPETPDWVRALLIAIILVIVVAVIVIVLSLLAPWILTAIGNFLIAVVVFIGKGLLWLLKGLLWLISRPFVALGSLFTDE